METGKNIRGETEVRTEITLAEGVKLQISTHKRYGGGVATVAQVYRQPEGYSLWTSTHALFSKDPYESDFRKELASATMRATEKAMEKQHTEALQTYGLQKLTDEAKAHHEARVAAKRIID